MAKHTILALFEDEDAAQGAANALNAARILEHRITAGTGDLCAEARRTAGRGPLDEGRVAVAPRRGRVLLSVQPDDAQRARAAEMIKRHGPVELVESADEQETEHAAEIGARTPSGAHADHTVSPGTIPETPPMPTGSGVFDSRSHWLVEREGEVGKRSDPEAAERRRLEREITEKS